MGSRASSSDVGGPPDGSSTGTASLLELAQRLIDRLRLDRSVQAVQMAEEAALFAKLFARWHHHPPTDGQREATEQAFFSLHHRAADYVSRHVTPEATPATQPDEDRPSESPPSPPDACELVARAAVERLVIDASLRGGLEKTAYAGLLAWATDRALATAASLGGEIDPLRAAGMVESLLAWLVRAAVDAAEIGEVAGLAAALDACPEAVIERELAAKLLERLELGEDAAANAAMIGQVLCAATPPDPL